MGAALDVVQQAYAAFGRHDISALVKLIADEVDWEGIAPATLPYAGRRRTPEEVANFFEALPQADDFMPLSHGNSLRLASTSPCWAGQKQRPWTLKSCLKPNGYTSSPLRAVRLLVGVAFLIRPRVTGKPQ
jgi:hypothetical protein